MKGRQKQEGNGIGRVMVGRINIGRSESTRDAVQSLQQKTNIGTHLSLPYLSAKERRIIQNNWTRP